MTNKKNEMRDVSMIRKSLNKILPLAAMIILSSCVNVAAPDQPIVINLNIKIEQEVLIRVADAVENAIESEENAGIF